MAVETKSDFAFMPCISIQYCINACKAFTYYYYISGKCGRNDAPI